MSDLHKQSKDNDREHENEKQQAGNKWEKIAQEAEQEKGAEPKHLDFPDRKQLEEQLTAAEAKAEEYKEQAMRVRAEADNAIRRAEQRAERDAKYGSEQLIHALLPAVDALIRGLESAEAHDPKQKTMRDGMQLTLDLLYKALTKFGVEMIDPASGEPFDPKLHEAMGMQAVPGAKSHTIFKVLQKGYQLHGRVLRAAMVMVVQ